MGECVREETLGEWHRANPGRRWVGQKPGSIEFMGKCVREESLGEGRIPGEGG